MPGIIVSRPIFNTLFKLAHEEGLSINAFLTRLLDNAGPDAVKQAVTGRVQAAEAAVSGSEAPGLASEPGIGSGPAPEMEIAGSEAIVAELGDSSPARASEPVAPRLQSARPIEYDEDPRPSAQGDGFTGERVPGRRIGNSVWDKVVSMEGHRFATSRGKKFSYKVTGEYIVVRDSSARIPRSQFDKAKKMWPVSGPSRLVGVYAPSVVWAVMKEVIEAEEPALA